MASEYHLGSSTPVVVYSRVVYCYFVYSIEISYPVRAHSAYKRHETFSFMMSLLAMSLGLRFCVSRKGGTGGGGWVHPKGANSMAVSGLILRSDLVGTGRVISFFFGINGVRNKRSHLVGPPFPEFKARFSATAGWHFSRDLPRRLVIGGCGHSHVYVC